MDLSTEPTETEKPRWENNGRPLPTESDNIHLFYVESREAFQCRTRCCRTGTSR